MLYIIYQNNNYYYILYFNIEYYIFYIIKLKLIIQGVRKYLEPYEMKYL
jgi:hypothetical protein